LTKNPIHKLINTHFHWDHWQGNQAYAATSPNLEIITSERTRENLTRPDAGNGGIAGIERQLTTLPKDIEKLKDDILKATDAEQKARWEAMIDEASLSEKSPPGVEAAYLALITWRWSHDRRKTSRWLEGLPLGQRAR
jgi:metal-dependent hydrolase (beta-lactamase superfamily II)